MHVTRYCEVTCRGGEYHIYLREVEDGSDHGPSHADILAQGRGETEDLARSAAFRELVRLGRHMTES